MSNTKNTFGISSSRWEQMDEHGKEQFNQIYPEVKSQLKQMTNEMPQDKRPQCDEQQLESFARLVVAETIRATQLHTT